MRIRSAAPMSAPMLQLHTSPLTHVTASCTHVSYTYTDVTLGMGWLRLVGSLKLYVCFAKEPYKREDILQKKNIILRSLLIVATPYQDRSSMCRRQMRQATGDVDMILYGVATISRLLKIIGLLARISSLL